MKLLFKLHLLVFFIYTFGAIYLIRLFSNSTISVEIKVISILITLLIWTLESIALSLFTHLESMEDKLKLLIENETRINRNMRI